MIAHIAKRIAFVVLGYFAALVAAAGAFPSILIIMSLRQLWLHLLISLLLAAGAGLLLVPDWFSAMTLDRWLPTLAIALSALIGGVVYWAIAGRMAGFRREEALAPQA